MVPATVRRAAALLRAASSFRAPRGWPAAGLLQFAPVRFLGSNGLNSRNDVLKLGDLPQRTPGWQPVVLGHCQDERALMRLQAFEESVELVRHGWAVAGGGGPRQPDMVRALVGQRTNKLDTRDTLPSTK